MQSYIRPLYEGLFDLRALMKSALPLLIITSASNGPCRRTGFGEAGLTYRVISSITHLASCGGIPQPLVGNFFVLFVKPFSW